MLFGCFLVTSLSAQTDEARIRIAPDFTLGNCVGADTLHLADFADNLVMLYLFDAGRVESRGPFRYLNEWYRRYENDGLRVIGIHCPELEMLKVRDNAITAISRTSPKIPVAMDMESKVCEAYDLTTLPTFILIRPGGEIILETSELKAYRKIEEAIQSAIKEIKPGVIHPFLLDPLKPADDPESAVLAPTPEIMAGHASGVVVDCDSSDFGRYKIYFDSRGREKGRIFLSGKWKVDKHSISYQQDGPTSEGTLRVMYSGKEAWLMLDFDRSKPPRVYVNQDRSNLPSALWGKDIRFDQMGRPQLNLRYVVPLHVATNPNYSAHELEFTVTGGDVTFYYIFFEAGLAE
jgi:hypothetical protein